MDYPFSKLFFVDGEIVTFKTCRRCEQNKPLDQFNNKKDGTGGVHAECKECLVIRVKENERKMPIEQKREYRTTARLKENMDGKKSYKKDLPKLLKVKELRTIIKRFPT